MLSKDRSVPGATRLVGGNLARNLARQEGENIGIFSNLLIQRRSHSMPGAARAEQDGLSGAGGSL